MNKIVMVFVLLTSLVFYYFFNKKEQNCVGTSDGVHYPKVFRAQRSEPIKLQFDMLRTPLAGCLPQKASEFYKQVGCGYKLINKDEWTPLTAIPKIDNELKYSVACEIPAIGDAGLDASTVEYYFEYSAWGGPKERQTNSIILE